MEHEVKVTAGIGELDAFEAFAKAGVDEVFCGFVPLKWNMKFGNLLPANRREVLFYYVQIGTIEEMKILLKLSAKYNINVSIVFNALYYNVEQLEMLGEIIEELIEIGFDTFIVSDIGLVLYLKKKKIPCKLHISGELGEVNTGTMKMLQDICSEENGPQIERWIFHRKQSLEEISTCITFGKALDSRMEFEAFFLNEKCHFAGGFCNSLHCDELIHLCQMPYEFVRLDKAETDSVVERWKEIQEQKEFIDGIGESGCGLCSLWRMKEIGITHLKVVGRGKSAKCMEEDIKAAKCAWSILRKCKNESEYIRQMKQHLFPNGCSQNCYYREIKKKYLES